MTERYPLVSESARRMAKYSIDAAPSGYVCEIKERTRTNDQNALLHSLLSDISKQKDYAGKKRSLDDWKAIMVSGHRMALNEAGEVVPGINGEFVQLRRSTAQMGVKELGSLIDFISAWASDNGVKLKAPEWREAA